MNDKYGIHGGMDTGIDLDFPEIPPEEDLEPPDFEDEFPESVYEPEGSEESVTLPFDTESLPEEPTEYTRGIRDGVDIAVSAMAKHFASEIERIKGLMDLQENKALTEGLSDPFAEED